VAWLIFLAIASLLVFRFFCRYLCPAGAAMAFFARHRLFGRIRPDKCLECGECMVSCPRGRIELRTSNVQLTTSKDC
jgi:polyferredoxin